MEASELRRACELAGLQWFEGQLGSMVNTGFSTMFIEDPALIPYVASLLVAKADPLLYFSALAEVLTRGPVFIVKATEEQRIRAAVAAMEVANTEAELS